jgi:hypothetical protein
VTSRLSSDTAAQTVPAKPGPMTMPWRSQASATPLDYSRDLLAVAGVVILAAVLLLVTWRTWGDFGGDTGYDLLAGSRLAGGELPYRDYIYYYGPLAPALLALCFSIGGVGLGSAVFLGVIVAISIVLLTYALTRVLVGPIGAFLAAAITAPVALSPTTFSFVLPHAYSAPLGVATSLGFLVALGRYALGASRRALILAGVFAGLTTLTRPEFTLAVFAAAGVWLAVSVWRKADDRVATVLWFGAPAFAIPTMIYGALLTVVSPKRLVFENLYPVETLRAAGNAILKIHAPMTAMSFVELAVKVLLYAAGSLSLVLLAWVLARPGALQRPVLAVACGLGVLIAVVAGFRLETVRYGLTFVYGWIPAGAACSALVCLVRSCRTHTQWTSAAQLQLVMTTVLAALAAKTYAAFFVYSTVPQYAVYAAPFAAAFLVHFHLVEISRNRTARAIGAVWLAFLASAGIGLTWKDARAESGTVVGPAGTVALKPKDAAVYQAAVSSILAQTRNGEAILLAPQLTMLYVMTGRTNPLPQLSLLPGALPTESDERAAIARLEDRGVRLVLVDRRPFTEYGHTTFGQSFQRLLARWVDEKFERVETLGDDGRGSPSIDVWRKKAS